MIPKVPVTEMIFVFRTRKTGALRIVPFGRDRHGFSSPSGKELKIAPGDHAVLHSAIFTALSKNSTQKYRLRKVPDKETDRELREDQLVGIRRTRKGNRTPWSYKIISFERHGAGFASTVEKNVPERKFENKAVDLIMRTFDRMP